VQLVGFRGNEVASSLFGPNRDRWARLFRARLEAAHWHLEFLAMAALLLLAAPILDALGRKRLPLFEVHRTRAVALAGIVSVREARAAVLDPAVDRTATARAFARPAQTLLADDDLGTAVERLSSAGVAEAVVVDASGKPVGVVSREGILEAWRRATVPG
jgi:CBS domain-containing protein